MGARLKTHCQRGHEFTSDNVYMSQGHRTCKTCRLMTNANWHSRNPTEREELDRRDRLKSRYGITVGKYEDMLSTQEGKCLICKNIMDKVCIDHDHSCCFGSKSCGKCIRGLLCDLCNKGLGQFKDDPLQLESALNYLKGDICRH